MLIFLFGKALFLLSFELDFSDEPANL